MPAKCILNFKNVIFKHISFINTTGICYEINIMWVPKTSVIGSHRCLSHNPSQGWPRSTLPYGAVKLHWVNCSRLTLCCGSLWFSLISSSVSLRPFNDCFRASFATLNVWGQLKSTKIYGITKTRHSTETTHGLAGQGSGPPLVPLL